MSLINQMLQDLDARSVDGIGDRGANGQVRAVAKRPRMRGVRAIAIIIAVGLLALVGWLVVNRRLPLMPVGPDRQLKLNSELTVVPLPAAKSQNTSKSVPASETAPSAPAASLAIAAPTFGIEKNNPVASTAKPIAVPATPLAAPVAPIPAGAMPVPAMSSAALPETLTSSEAAKETDKPLPLPASLKSVAPTKIDALKSALAETPVPLTKRVAELTPNQRAENEFRKASNLMLQGRSADAIVVLDQTLQIDPQHAAARQTLVALLMEAKRPDDAIRRLQDGLKLDPSQAGSAMILARLQVERGEQAAAIATLERTLTYGIDRADYYAFLAALLQREGRHKEAVDHYLIALRKTPQNGVWWMGLGISLQADGRAPAAQDAFKRSKATNSLTPDLQAFVEQKIEQLTR